MNEHFVFHLYCSPQIDNLDCDFLKNYGQVRTAISRALFPLEGAATPKSIP